MLPSWASSEPAKAQARPPDPLPSGLPAPPLLQQAAGLQEGRRAAGAASRPPHSSSPAPSIPGSECSSAPGRFRTVVPGTGVPPGPLPVRLSRVPPCDVRKPCSQRSGRGSSLPPCPAARERSALSRGAPGTPGFPFPSRAQTRGAGGRAGPSLGAVAPRCRRLPGAWTRTLEWSRAAGKFGLLQGRSWRRAELARERKSWRRLPLEAEHAPLQAAARAGVFFFNSKKRCISKTTRGRKKKKKGKSNS